MVAVNAVQFDIKIDHLLTRDQCALELQPYKLANLPVTVGTNQTMGMVDTGAQLSLLGYDTARALQASGAPILRARSRSQSLAPWLEPCLATIIKTETTQ